MRAKSAGKWVQSKKCGTTFQAPMPGAMPGSAPTRPYTRVRDALVRMAAARAMDAIASRPQANRFRKPEEPEEEK